MYQTDRFRKLAVALMMIAAMLMAVTGCSGSADSNSADPGAGISANSIDTFAGNGITIETVTLFEDEVNERGQTEYPVIDGLKNDEVEKMVNALIYARYLEFVSDKDLPPYRGIKVATMDTELTEISEYFTVTANVNNVLSIQFVKYYDFSGIDTFMSCSDVMTLNIDLNTGKEISLSDVFADDIDMESYVNKYMDTKAVKYEEEDSSYESGNSLPLTAAFEGVNEDQKFYIDQYHNSLILIFDYNDPEFNFPDFYPCYVCMPLDEVGALGSRYYDRDNCIYEDETPDYKLVVSEPNADSVEDYNETIKVGSMIENAEISVTAIYYTNLPKSALEKIESVKRPNDEAISDYGEQLAMAIEEFGTDGMSLWGYYDINTDRVGAYAVIARSMDVQINKDIENDYSVLMDESSVDRYIYDCVSGEEVSIQDFFCEGVDREAVIKSAMIKSCQNCAGELYEPLDDSQISELVDGLYASIRYFEPWHDSFMIIYDDDEETVIRNIVRNEDDYWQVRSEMSEIKYTQFGCDNLNIFWKY